MAAAASDEYEEYDEFEEEYDEFEGEESEMMEDEGEGEAIGGDLLGGEGLARGVTAARACLHWFCCHTRVVS